MIDQFKLKRGLIFRGQILMPLSATKKIGPFVRLETFKTCHSKQLSHDLKCRPIIFPPTLPHLELCQKFNFNLTNTHGGPERAISEASSKAPLHEHQLKVISVACKFGQVILTVPLQLS